MERKLVWLEVMRGFAALWVLAHHAELSTAAFFGNIGSTFISRGYLGVDFFFILSGFIIALSSQRMIDAGRSYNEFFALRLSRIYAAYLPIGIALYFVYQFFPGLSASGREVGALSSFTLVPTDLPPALSVAWTLQHELLFYLIFSTVFISKRFGAACLTSWLGFIAWSWLAGAAFDNAFLGLLSHPINMWFFVGIAVFLVKDFDMRPTIFFASVIGFALTVYVCTEAGANRIFVGTALAMLILFFSKVRNITVIPPQLLIYFGAASYSIYLIHSPVQSVIARLMPLLFSDPSPWVAFGIISGCSLMAGIFYYAAFEMHATLFFKRLIRTRLTGPPITGLGQKKTA